MGQKGIELVGDWAYYTTWFDTTRKAQATAQYMIENEATFDEATAMLGYQQGVDFILFLEKWSDDGED